jgi:hypothetical protein
MAKRPLPVNASNGKGQPIAKLYGSRHQHACHPTKATGAMGAAQLAFAYKIKISKS